MRVPYAQALYEREEIEAVLKVLEERPHALMGGDEVRTFEARVAALFAKRHGLMVNSGSSANALAIAALELPPGAEVVTPALTFATTVAPLVQQGLVPAFVDVEEDTFNVDVDQVEAMIGAATEALLIPNLIGNLPDWEALRKVATRHGLVLIEDSADTIGARIGGESAGRFSDISTTSFYASHVITCCGFGGAACFNDPAFARRATLLRGWGRASSLAGESESVEDRFGVEIDGIPYDAKFVFSAIGYNFLPSEVAAAFGNVQLGRLGEYGERRIANFRALSELFAAYEEWFVPPRQRPEVRTAWLAFPLIVRDDAPFTRRELQIHLEGAGVQTRAVFTGNVLRQPGFKDIHRRARAEGYPNADRVMRGGILLGCHQGLGEAHFDYLGETFRSFARKFGDGP